MLSHHFIKADGNLIKLKMYGARLVKTSLRRRGGTLSRREFDDRRCRAIFGKNEREIKNSGGGQEKT